jgi:hypothetical protein
MEDTIVRKVDKTEIEYFIGICGKCGYRVMGQTLPQVKSYLSIHQTSKKCKGREVEEEDE